MVGQFGLMALEDRVVPASVLTSHNDISGTGANLAETTISPANVRAGSFGKLFVNAVDGQVYAEPIVWNGIPAANRTRPDAANVVFVATEHDTVYAIATDTALAGTVLWSRSFLDIRNINGRVNNPEGATSISTLSSTDVATMDITPEVGITSTPVLDTQTATLYVVVKTKTVVGGVTHYIQRLHALNTADGSDRATPYVIGDTTLGVYGNATDRTAIFVYGTGDGSYPDTYYHTNRTVVTFNALRSNQRSALRLVNGEVYVAWASHGDNGPYHGWVAKFDVSNLSQGIRLSGVLNTSPNNGQSGIWQSGGGLSFEPDGSAFYLETGNGQGGAPPLGADGFPSNGNYSEAVMKVIADPNSTATNQNINGWGFRVSDYFVPHNIEALDAVDADFGSGAPLVLPDSAGIPGHPHLLIAAGKEGKIYVLDRDHLGKFNTSTDDVVSVTPLKFLNGVFSSPVWFNGALYYVGAFGGKAKRLTLNQNGELVTASETPTNTFGNLPGSPSISSNGTTGGIVWLPNRDMNTLHAYDANSLTTELWNSGQDPADNLGAVVKFAIPAVADGQVYVGTGNSLVVYGLKPAVNALPLTPTGLTAVTLSSTSIQLSWVDPTTAPNTATGYAIEQSTDGVTFVPATTVPSGTGQAIVGGLTPLTPYVFRVRGFNGLGNSPFSATAAQTTSGQLAMLDFTGGFAGSPALLTYNGNAAVNGMAARITDGTTSKAGSVFSTQTVDISRFTTQFTTRQTGPGDGMTFTIQAYSPNALGQLGGSLGYGNKQNGGGGIPNSAAIKLDIFGSSGELPTSTGLYMNGAYPGNTGASDLRAAGVILNSGNVMRVAMSYDGSNLTVTITDTVTAKFFTRIYPLDLPAVIGTRNAYVGFTGATAGLTAVQDVLSWTFSPNAVQTPATPAALGSATASATSVSLNWTNTATNQTGYQLDRASNAAFTQNLTTQNLPASPANFTDNAPGLSPGNTYFYRIRATNTAGPSANSNTTSVTIPLAPARASDVMVTGVFSSHIDLQWTDNAGLSASGYRILRAIDRGLFSELTTLPPFNTAGPNTYVWSDTSVAPGHFYEYHIIAFNVSGYNDFVGGNATTPLPSAVDLGGGFTGATTLKFNGSAAINGSAARITDGGVGKTGSVFTNQTVDVSQFRTEFTFRQTGKGDGMTFAIQANSPTALGRGGGSLGYGTDPGGKPGIGLSAAIKFDLFNNDGEGSSSTGLYLNGAYPTSAGSVNLQTAGITLNSGNLMRVVMTYDGTTLKVTITDTVTNRLVTQSYAVSLASVLGTTNAYVGFTGASGGLTAVQDVLSWTYGPNTV
ncbi:fibronectin type III domain-containing protein [Zavarzinella formosa]|uniref:fibronectin type III domain-containing protein n=1 Tax=Zavarzinella formosa TaxID=360055 RepID=UPI00138AB047|nr:fibronectin type III domain-containing protein [Zavarzinella formosa]